MVTKLGNNCGINDMIAAMFDKSSAVGPKINVLLESIQQMGTGWVGAGFKIIFRVESTQSC